MAFGSIWYPDQRENIEDIFGIDCDNSLVSNFTTSGFGIPPENISMCRSYCGAVAFAGIEVNTQIMHFKYYLLWELTNIHDVMGDNSIDKAIYRLKNYWISFRY